MTAKRYIFIEIVLLLFLITMLIFGCYSFLKTKLGNEKEYHIIFHDIDGLIVGSPVRLMGVDIGHVQKIQNIYDDIHLTFVITDKNVKIPKAVIATVQFTGIAGSKSLEILPLRNCKQCGYIVLTQEPIRINKAFSLQNAITESLVGYSKSITELIGNKTAKDVRVIIKKSINETTKMNKNLDKINNVLQKHTGKITLSSTEIKKTINEDTNEFDQEEIDFIKSLDEFSAFDDFNSFVKTNLDENDINKRYKSFKNTHKIINTLNYEKDYYERSYEIAETLDFYLKEASKIVNKTTNLVSKDNLEHIKKHVKAFKKRTEILKDSN
ncbi:MAG: MlaD family protein [Candidatus Gastranaerophilaceae bacterium]|jgi:hypothetical protein